MGIIRSLWSRRAWLGGLGASACASVAEVRADERGVINVGAGGVAYRRRGGGAPLIVFESGLGDGLGVWDATFDALDPALPLFAYSRPGYGESTPIADEARTSDEVAAHLRETLLAAGERGPFLLVGHSLGGLYIAKFAGLYPRETAGLVFVDGRPPNFRATCAARGVSFCDGSGLRQTPPGWPGHIVAEAEGVEPTENMAPSAAAIAAVPAVVITSTNAWPGEGGAEAFALWLETQEAFAGGFRAGQFVRAEGAGHYVQREQPALVAGEIAALWGRVS